MYMNTLKTNELFAETLKRFFPYPVDERVEFLSRIRDDSTLKAVFECLIFRMPVEGLKEMFASGAASSDFDAARNEFLVAMASDRDPSIRKAEAALEKVERAISENNEVKEYLKTEIASAFKELKDNHQDEIRLLNDQIDFLKYQYAAAKEQIDTMKESSAQKQPNPPESTTRYSGVIPDNQQTEFIVPELYRKRLRPHSRAWKEMETFCTELAKHPDLSNDQKWVLLSCLEEGYPVEAISKIMVSTLSLEQMKSFVKVYAKRMNGKKFK